MHPGEPRQPRPGSSDSGDGESAENRVVVASQDTEKAGEPIRGQKDCQLRVSIDRQRKRRREEKEC